MPCAMTTYKPFIGNNSCVSCPAITHTVGSGATAIDDCVCDSGWTLADDVCVACPEHHFSSPLTGGSCWQCPPNSGSYAAASLCYCNAGYELEGSACASCVAGTYKTARDESMCEQCPAHMSSPSASTHAAACSCLPGYERQDTTTCVLCGADSFCPGLDVKIHCPAHSTSPLGASARKDCLCDAGYFLYDGACVQCGESFFCRGGVRTPCPENSTSAHSSTDAQNCTCFDGYGVE